jgi:hypothetical protein
MQRAAVELVDTIVPAIAGVEPRNAQNNTIIARAAISPHNTTVATLSGSSLAASMIGPTIDFGAFTMNLRRFLLLQ